MVLHFLLAVRLMNLSLFSYLLGEGEPFSSPLSYSQPLCLSADPLSQALMWKV